jgi:hypothetical protein
MSRPRSKSPNRPRRRRKTRAARGGMDYYPPPFFVGSIRPRHSLRRRRESSRKGLIGEVAERSKALDWNSSNILTGIRGFESHPLRQFNDLRSPSQRSGSLRCPYRFDRVSASTRVTTRPIPRPNSSGGRPMGPPHMDSPASGHGADCHHVDLMPRKFRQCHGRTRTVGACKTVIVTADCECRV